MKLKRTMSILVAIGCITPQIASSADDDATRRRTIRGWIHELDHDRFATRQAATQKLIEAGAPVIPSVREAAGQNNPEVILRSIDVLLRLSTEGDPESIRLAAAALVDLKSSKNRMAAREARKALERRQSRLVAKIEELGARVAREDGHVVSISFQNKSLKDEDLAILAEFPDVERLDFYKSTIGDAGLVHLKGLTKLRRLPLGSTKVTDAGLVHLRDMTQLTYLGLRADNITDAGLVHLKKLTNLTGLYLGETKVTDAGLIHIRHLTKMEFLRLDTMRVSDTGLIHLKDMTNLTHISVYNTHITESGVRKLRDWFPNCNVDTEE